MNSQKNRPLPRHTMVLTCILTQLAAGACTEPTTTPAADIIEWEAFPHTVILDQQSLEAITAANADLSEITFAPQAQLENLARGKVIVGGVGPYSPNGILRTVEAVERDADSTRVTTRPASLLHAFRRLRVEVQREHLNESAGPINIFQPPAPGGMASPLTISGANLGVARSPLTVTKERSLGGPIDWIVFDGDGDNATTDDRVQIVGSLTANLGFTFKLSFDLGSIKIDPLEFPPDIDVAAIDLTVSLQVDLGAEAQLDLAGVASLTYEKEQLLGTITLSPITVGPVVLLPVVSARAGVQGGASSSFQLGISESISFSSGISYTSDDGLKTSFQPPTNDFRLSDAAVHLGASGKVWIRPEVALLAYGVIGPTAGIEAYARVEAHVDQEPCWALYGGFDATLGLALELLSVRLLDERVTIPLVEQEIGSGACTLPPKVTDIEPTFTPSSSYLPETLLTSGDSTDWTDLKLTTDGRFVVASAQSQRLVKVHPDGTPLWARSFRTEGEVFDEQLYLQSVAPTLDGGMLVGTSPHYLLKLSADGALERAMRPADPGAIKSGFNVLLPSRDGTLVAGRIYDQGDDQPDLWLIKLDHAGEISWSVRWGQPEVAETPRALIELDDGYAVIGTSFSVGQEPAHRGLIIRLDREGNTRWARELIGCTVLEGVELRAGLLSRDGDLVVGGAYAAPQRMLLAKIKPDGALAWTAAHRATGSGIGLNLTTLQQLDSGGFIIGGTYITAGNSDDIWVAAADAIGRLDWIRRYSGAVDEQAPALLLTPDNGILIAAPTGSFGQDPGADAGLWLLKVPRKDGQITFVGTDPALLGLEHAIVTPCLTSVVSAQKTTEVSLILEQVPVEASSPAASFKQLAP